jgi:hypothetical protein
MINWLVLKLFAPSVANAVAGWPPSRLAFRLGICVVDATLKDGVPVATVETNCEALTFPFAVIFPLPSTRNRCAPLFDPNRILPPAELLNDPATPLALATMPTTPAVFPVVL